MSHWGSGDLLCRRFVISCLVWIINHNGAWLSLVERLVWDQEAAGSNPVAPIFFVVGGRLPWTALLRDRPWRNKGYDMRKRIGVFIGELDCEYAIEMVPNIFNAASRKGMDLVVFGNFGTYDRNISLYSDGEKSVIKLPDYDKYEGIIIEESRFNIPDMASRMHEELTPFLDRVPVVYLGADKENCYSVIGSDRKAIKTVTEHFIKEHGFKRIYHLAGRIDLDDAHERHRGYMEAMEEAGLSVTDNMVYWGDYWYNKVSEALDHFLDGGDEYPEAIVCANDYMAIAMIAELIKRGKRVPEDICVSGYDNVEDGKLVSPPLTTIEISKERMAETAVDIIVRARQGEDVPRVTYIEDDFRIIPRNSCGCCHFDENRALASKLLFLRYHFFGMDMSVLLQNGLSIAFDLDGIFTSADGFFSYLKADAGYLCLCDDAIGRNKRTLDNMDSYTDKMILKRIFYQDEEKSYDSPDQVFGRGDLLPPDYMDSIYDGEPKLLFVFPVHSLNHPYGYLVLHYQGEDWPNKFTQAYAYALGEAIDNYNMRSEHMVLERIKRAYLMDDLTDLYNRRGYEQNLQTCVDRMRRHGLKMTLVSIDMDGLKYINDNFGHSEGDFALISVADAVRSCLDDDEYASRNGGDEFAAILLSDDEKRAERFERNMNERLSYVNEWSDKPYPIHASMGFCTVYKAGENIRAAMKKADDLMYLNKKKYKEEHPEYARERK